MLLLFGAMAVFLLENEAITAAATPRSDGEAEDGRGDVAALESMEALDLCSSVS